MKFRVMKAPKPSHQGSSTNAPVLDALYQQGLSVSFHFPVHFTHGLFRLDNPVFVESVTRLEPDRRHRLFFIIDAGITSAQPDLLSDIERYLHHHDKRLQLAKPPVIVPGGESAKNDVKLIEELQGKLLAAAIDRQSFIVAIGGGAVIDLAGYLAATFHRGVRHIRIPTTVLSQNDSGVSVKNGVNAFGIKNLLGTFAPPFAVINDDELLRTLEPRDTRAGMAEAVKVSLVRDPGFFQWIEQNGHALATFEPDELAFLIRRCAELHMQHIARCGDPFELASARPLDFGHWAAHKLENLTQYRLRHGEAVAIGLALDTRYSFEAGLLDACDCERVVGLLELLGFRLWHPQMGTRDSEGQLLLLDGLREFHEHLGGEFSVTLLSAIGSMLEVHEMDHDRILTVCRWLQARDRDRT